MSTVQPNTEGNQISKHSIGTVFLVFFFFFPKNYLLNSIWSPTGPQYFIAKVVPINFPKANMINRHVHYLKVYVCTFQKYSCIYYFTNFSKI